MTVHARHYSTGLPIAVSLDAGKVVSITASDKAPTAWIAPAFFDIQINGCSGIGFTNSHLNLDMVRRVVERCRIHGIGGFLPTVITSAEETLLNSFATLRRSIEADPYVAKSVQGFHLEGPFISPEDGPRGAHPLCHVRDPNYDIFRRLQDAAGGRIRMVTLAPERPNALRLIEQLTADGVVVAIGHTSAKGNLIRDAVTAGAKISTHLGNGCHATLPRHDNYLWEQLACDDLVASVIADGHHLPPAVLKCIIRGKTTKRIILTCDAGTFAGCPAGRYSDWGTEVEVYPDGKTTLPGTPYLAGSGVLTDKCVAHIITKLSVNLADAIEMSSVRPRQLLGLARSDLVVGSTGPFITFENTNDSIISTIKIFD